MQNGENVFARAIGYKQQTKQKVPTDQSLNVLLKTLNCYYLVELRFHWLTLNVFLVKYASICLL